MGAKIERFSCVGYDRVIEIDVKAKNEMSDEVTNKIYVELLGRYSNVIVCDEDNTISEAMIRTLPMVAVITNVFLLIPLFFIMIILHTESQA